MTDSAPQPTTIEELEWAVWPSFALLAGIRLDLFTLLKDGPLSVEQLADQLGVEADKLKSLLYALAAAGLLKVENGLFSNSSEANRFLVRGLSTYRGGKHEVLLNNWQAGVRTAESIRTGAPQAKLDFADASAAELEIFYRSNHAQAIALHPRPGGPDLARAGGYTRSVGASARPAGRDRLRRGCSRQRFPGETFRVIKEKEIARYDEYCTRRLVLEAWDKLEQPGRA